MDGDEFNKERDEKWAELKRRHDEDVDQYTPDTFKREKKRIYEKLVAKHSSKPPHIPFQVSYDFDDFELAAFQLTCDVADRSSGAGHAS